MVRIKHGKHLIWVTVALSSGLQLSVLGIALIYKMEMTAIGLVLPSFFLMATMLTLKYVCLAFGNVPDEGNMRVLSVH